MVVDKSYGLTVETMATHVLPLLIPHTVNPGLNLEQYCMLVEVNVTKLIHIFIYMNVDAYIIYTHIYMKKYSYACTKGPNHWK